VRDYAPPPNSSEFLVCLHSHIPVTIPKHPPGIMHSPPTSRAERKSVEKTTAGDVAYNKINKQ